MSIEDELKKRLNNPENDFPTNLACGIKLWRSKSFYYLAKYEIVTEFFSSNLLEFYKSIRKLNDDKFNEKWTIVNEFLTLDCPLGALSKSQHENITEAIPKIASKSLKRPRRIILDSLVIITLKQRYKNFYKYDIGSYGLILKECLIYYKTILTQSSDLSKEVEAAQIKDILKDLSLYVKVGSNVEEMRDTFYNSIITDLSEIVLVLKNENVLCFDDLISILKELYFIEGSSIDYYRFPKEKSHLFMGRFDITVVPVHILAILIEGYVAAYKSSKADLMNFTKHLFTSTFVDVESSVLKSTSDIFAIISSYFIILKKYFIKIEQILLQEYDFTRFIPMKIQEMFEKYKTNDDVLCGIFNLISTIIDYNPLILEKEIINLVIQFMFTQKTSESCLKLYQNVLLSSIDLFTKLNRKEQFRTELFSKLSDFLETNDSNKLISDLKPKNLKRSQKAVPHVVSKKLKLESMDDSSSILIDNSDTIPIDYMKLLTKTGKEETLTKTEFHQASSIDDWNSIAFAWPDQNNKLRSAMINYIAVQRSKMNFNFLYNLRDYLTEVLECLGTEQNEKDLFKLDLYCCFLCYFFNGNAMIEQSNLYWEKLQTEVDKFDECMSNFGRLIVNQKCDGRIICAFLKLANYFENFKMVTVYYQPDSIQNIGVKSPNLYLADNEWEIIENKSNVANKMEWNRLKVSRLRFLKMFGDVEHNLKELGEFENSKNVLLDKATNYWLISQLTDEQKVKMSHEILNNFTKTEDILFITKNLISDQEFVSKFIVVIFENLSKLMKTSLMAKVSFDDCYEMNEVAALKKISKLIKKKCELVIEEDNLSKVEQILTVLAGIQINELKIEYKNVIIALGFLLFFDLKANENAKLTKMAKNIVMAQIKFGKFPDVCKYLGIEIILEVFSPIDDQNKEFIQCLFQQIIFHMTRNSMDMQKSLLAKFKEDKSCDLFKMVIISSEYLVKVNANYLTDVTKEEIKDLVDEYMQVIVSFAQKNVDKPTDECLYGLTLVIRHMKNHTIEFSANVLEIFDKFLNYSLKTSSVWTSIFLTNALNYEGQFKLNEDKIDQIIENRWKEFQNLITKDLNGGAGHDASESVLRMLNIDPLRLIATFIISNQTDLQLQERFKVLEESAKSNLRNILRIYTTLIKKGLSKKTAKTNTVLTKSIELIISEIIQPLTITKKFVDDTTCLYEILDFFDSIIQNSKIQLSPKAMDKILEFIENINIKKHKIVNGEEKLFFKLNQQISGILYGFIVNKDFYVLNRLSQYLHVFNGLLCSIIGYKDDRNEQETLESFEILSLSDLLHPLEKIMNILVKYEKDLKLIAPYELVSIITFIITSKRSTTLHDMIKKSINNICYELISIYDKHAPSYILRTCGEAEKNIYTEMVKNYGKYRSFKGKI